MRFQAAFSASLVLMTAGLCSSPSSAGQTREGEALDPPVVVAGTAAVAKSLSDLLGTWEPNNSVALAKLKPVQDANPKTHDLLRQAVDVSAAYGAGVDPAQRPKLDSAQDALRAKSAQFYSIYRGELTSSFARWRAPGRYRSQILGDVGRVGDQLMTPAFGYAPADTVGHAMVLELWMKRRLKHPRSDIKARAGAYLGYFDRALDPSVGSVASKSAALSAQRARYQKILDEADVKVGSSGWVTVDTWQTERQENDCRYVTTHTRRTTVSGNQSQGYEAIPTTSSDTVKSCHHVCSGGQCLLASPPLPVAIMMSNETRSPLDIAPPSDGNPVGMANYWNSLRDARVPLDRDIGILTKHLDGIAEYRRFAKAVSDNP